MRDALLDQATPPPLSASAYIPPRPINKVSACSYLQGSLAEVDQPLDEVIFGFRHQLLDLLPVFGQCYGVVAEVVENSPKVLPAAINENPAWGTDKRYNPSAGPGFHPPAHWGSWWEGRPRSRRPPAHPRHLQLRFSSSRGRGRH